jgi:hypothetical protein
MATKKIPTVIAVTLGVWIAALGSAAALTYDLNRPLKLEVNPPPIEVASNPTRVVSAEPISGVQQVLYLPPITILARYRPVGPRAQKTFEDLSGQQCTDWRELDMGSGHVQVCE